MPETTFANILSSDEKIQYDLDIAELKENPDLIFLVVVQVANNFIGIYPLKCSTLEYFIFKEIKNTYQDTWSQTHPPEKIIEIKVSSHKKYIKHIEFMTLRYMYIYGIKFVRPMTGKYFEHWLKPEFYRQLKQIQNMEFRGSCFCGENHTNICDCQHVGCTFCKSMDHFYIECTNKNKNLMTNASKSLQKCLKCTSVGNPDAILCNYCGGPFEGSILFER